MDRYMATVSYWLKFFLLLIQSSSIKLAKEKFNVYIWFTSLNDLYSKHQLLELVLLCLTFSVSLFLRSTLLNKIGNAIQMFLNIQIDWSNFYSTSKSHWLIAHALLLQKCNRVPSKYWCVVHRMWTPLGKVLNWYVLESFGMHWYGRVHVSW